MSAGDHIDGGTVTIPTTAGGTAITTGRSTRKGLIVQNLAASADLYVGPSGVSTSSGIKIPAGDSMNIDQCSGAVFGISSSGSIDVRWMGVY